MLSKEIMGVLALGILWVNTLLVAAAAWKEIAALAERRRRLALIGEGEPGVGLVRAKLARGDGPGGALAVHRVEQVGRAGAEVDEKRTILFADRGFSGEAFGGLARLEGGGSEITIEAAESAEVWLAADEIARAAACPSDEAFDAAYETARKARGHARTVGATIEGERFVWLFGHLRRRGEGLSLSAPAGGSMLISTVDPHAWIGRKTTLATLFIVLELALAGACTAVALQRPHFGLVSTLGGALCLGYFLLVQPAGVSLREAMRAPSKAFLRGRWMRTSPGGPQEAPTKGNVRRISERAPATSDSKRSPTVPAT
jgi:hypothetical protein